MDEDVIEQVLHTQNYESKKLMSRIVRFAHELEETYDLAICLNIEKDLKELLLNSGIFISEMRDISEDSSFGE